ncbi:MAG: hypothetical protein FWG88_01785 [Oscillospiraceae bacterium]|nr:hypothetical protein [Oscillospiraceae bacterium]
MEYKRYDYGDPDAPKYTVTSPFGETTYPKFDYPISIIENYKRSAQLNKPMWVPLRAMEVQSISPNDMIRPTDAVKGQSVAMDFTSPKTGDYTFTDWFETEWTYVHSAGGPMLTPGFVQCEDVTDWEKCVKFPNFDDWDWTTFHEDYMKNRYDPNKVLAVDIGLGCTERFVSIMGGYTEAMIAFATEPEACKAFFEAFIDHEIEQFDRLMALYPINHLTYHDDWSNEKDTFFSPAMLEDMLMEPTKRFIDHVKSKDVVFDFHICGNMMRFAPYFAQLGVNLMQLQRRAIDAVALKKEYGNYFGFGGGIEGLTMGTTPTKEELVKLVRATVDLFAPKGGFYASVNARDPEVFWNGITEFYAYSREFYDKENATI